MKKNIFLSLYEFSFVLLFFKTLSFYYFWNIPIVFFSLINLVFFLLYAFYEKNIKLNIKLGNVIAIFFLFLSYIVCIISGRGIGFISHISVLLCILLLLLISISAKKNILRTITVIFSFISFISLIFYIIVVFLKINLPYKNVEYSQYTYRLYYFFLFRTYDSIVLEYNRFHSLFLEPGHLGCVAVLLLNANGFNLKNKYNIMLLISVFFTFSLAAYFLLFITFVFLNFKLKNLKYILCGLLVLLCVFVYYMNKKDSIIYQEIISRLIITDDGNIAGNNRYTSTFTNYYQTFIKTKNLFLGIGPEYKNMSGMQSAGYKVYIVQYGIIGTFSVILFNFMVYIKNFSRKSFFLFLINLLIFINLGTPLWACILITYIIGCESLSKETGKINYENKKSS